MSGEDDLRAALRRVRSRRGGRDEEPPFEAAVLEYLRRILEAAEGLETFVLARLAATIERHFDLGELRGLAFRMNIDDENLAGETLMEKSISLVQFCDRRGRLAELVGLVREERPHAF